MRVPTVVKQYGEQRTGTNYVRALLRRNFPDALVLSYILGDKHSPPVDFRRLWDEAQSASDPALTFIRTATYERPGSASFSSDLTQARDLRRKAAMVAAAFAESAIRFVVTIKDPYAWIVSVAHFERWVRNGEPLPPWTLERIAEACVRYNANYSVWLRHVNTDASWHLIRYGDLLEDPLREVASFGITAWSDIAERVDPAAWDHLPSSISSENFDRSYYSEKRYLRQLPDEHRRIITDTIDWRLLEPIGYTPC